MVHVGVQFPLGSYLFAIGTLLLFRLELSHAVFSGTDRIYLPLSHTISNLMIEGTTLCKQDIYPMK